MNNFLDGRNRMSFPNDGGIRLLHINTETYTMASFNALIVTANVSLQAEFIVAYGKGQSLLVDRYRMDTTIYLISAIVFVFSIQLFPIHYSSSLSQ
jgi:hypothetical protein